MENTGSTIPNSFNNIQKQLPNATAVLVLGIVSIIGCCCYGIVGIICGIIALIIAKKDMALYAASPADYTQSSYNNLKAGRICAMIGLSISILYLILVIVMIATVGFEALRDPNFLKQLQNR